MLWTGIALSGCDSRSIFHTFHYVEINFLNRFSKSLCAEKVTRARMRRMCFEDFHVCPDRIVKGVCALTEALRTIYPWSHPRRSLET